MIVLVDDRHGHRFAIQTRRDLEPAKTRADDDDWWTAESLTRLCP